eukprot:15471668-Alexandrium_andersonii.AAC.1
MSLSLSRRTQRPARPHVASWKGGRDVWRLPHPAPRDPRAAQAAWLINATHPDAVARLRT